MVGSFSKGLCEQWEALTPAEKEPFIKQSEQLQIDFDIWREAITKDGRLQKVEALQTKLKAILKELTYDKPKQPAGASIYYRQYGSSPKSSVSDTHKVGARVCCFCSTWRIFNPKE